MIDQELISFEIPSKIIQSDRNINDIFHAHGGIPILILIMYNKKRNEDRRLHPVR